MTEHKERWQPQLPKMLVVTCQDVIQILEKPSGFIIRFVFKRKWDAVDHGWKRAGVLTHELLDALLRVGMLKRRAGKRDMIMRRLQKLISYKQRDHE